MKQRLDRELVDRQLVASRAQAESYIKLGEVLVGGKVITKAGYLVDDNSVIKLTTKQQYVSRAALKLASVTEQLKLDFSGKTILDVGSSTGGFTDYALRHGAIKVIAVDVGTNQLHQSLRTDPRIELHEQTDIRDLGVLSQTPDIVVIDVSFVSLRDILPTVARLVNSQTQIVAMVKPQFEANASNLRHHGVIKNDKLRRSVLKDFELWAHQNFITQAKADSAVKGSKGNQERFYLLKVKKLTPKMLN